ncbi:Aste57867_2086 [Aphanomyces stellatus]|uniref:Aste57867_2086 protein n=2 Tax=Aphanomyces stellatus TaxID=120398 RepID=A0A485K867_9STRA|nr:hypothetical protein As57867_002081 [Aphanomyces stellatus]VFT79289.1 Aste57867_2086 [Aphanomyces stellatus]
MLQSYRRAAGAILERQRNPGKRPFKETQENRQAQSPQTLPRLLPQPVAAPEFSTDFEHTMGNIFYIFNICSALTIEAVASEWAIVEDRLLHVCHEWIGIAETPATLQQIIPGEYFSHDTDCRPLDKLRKTALALILELIDPHLIEECWDLYEYNSSTEEAGNVIDKALQSISAALNSKLTQILTVNSDLVDGFGTHCRAEKDGEEVCECVNPKLFFRFCHDIFKHVPVNHHTTSSNNILNGVWVLTNMSVHRLDGHWPLLRFMQYFTAGFAIDLRLNETDTNVYVKSIIQVTPVSGIEFHLRGEQRQLEESNLGDVCCDYVGWIEFGTIQIW